MHCSVPFYIGDLSIGGFRCVCGERVSWNQSPMDTKGQLKLEGVKIYPLIFDSSAVYTSNPHVVQGSTISVHLP